MVDSKASHHVSLPPLEAHRIWAEVYDTEPNPLLALEYRLLSGKLILREADRILDLGCGTGRWITNLRHRRAFGMDLCAEMLAKARPKPGVSGHIVRGDICALPFARASADVTICSFCAGYISDLRSMMRETARVLRPHGRAYLSDFHPSGHGRGWLRSFRLGARTIEIDDYRYALEDLIREAREAGLAVVDLIESGFGEPERDIFRQASKEDEFEKIKPHPALFIAAFRRT